MALNSSVSRAVYEDVASEHGFLMGAYEVDLPWLSEDDERTCIRLLIPDHRNVTREQAKTFDADLHKRELYIVDLIWYPSWRIEIVLENLNLRNTSESYAARNSLAFDGYDTPDRLYSALFG